MSVAPHPLLRAVQPLLARVDASAVHPCEMINGDVPLSWDGVLVAGIRLPVHDRQPDDSDAPAAAEPASGAGEHSGLDGILASVQVQFATPLADLQRADKQVAVRMLEEGGAFSYRKSVETVAAALGVSRFTVYNYLNRDRG